MNYNAMDIYTLDYSGYEKKHEHIPGQLHSARVKHMITEISS